MELDNIKVNIKTTDIKVDNIKTTDIKVDNIKTTDIKVDNIKADNIKVDTNYSTKQWLRNLTGEILEKFFRFIIFWEKDNKSIGIIIRHIHRFIIYSGIFFYFIINVVTSSYIIFLLYYLCWVITWLQHIIMGGCIITDIETRLINDNKNGFLFPVLDVFNITITPDSNDGIVLLASTVIVFVLSQDFIIRTLRYIKL